MDHPSLVREHAHLLIPEMLLAFFKKCSFLLSAVAANHLPSVSGSFPSNALLCLQLGELFLVPDHRFHLVVVEVGP